MPGGDYDFHVVHWKMPRRESMKKVLLLLVCSIFALSAITFAQTGVKKKRALPYEYGRVVINN